MPCTESPVPEDPVPKGPVCHDTTQTHNSLLVKHTHTLTCWFTRLANDQCRHTHTNIHTQTINADTRTLMLQPYQMPYVKLLWYLHNCISFNCKYYRSFTSNVCLISTYTRKLKDVNRTLSWQWKVQRRSLGPINVYGFPSSQYAGVQHVCTLTAASCKRTCQRKQLPFERIKITLRQLRTSLELNPVNTGVLRIDLQRHLLHTRKAHLSRICNDFKPNYTQQLRSTTLAKKHKQQQQKMK